MPPTLESTRARDAAASKPRAVAEAGARSGRRRASSVASNSRVLEELPSEGIDDEAASKAGVWEDDEARSSRCIAERVAIDSKTASPDAPLNWPCCRDAMNAVEREARTHGADAPPGNEEP